MESESSLPCSQNPATGFYSEPDEASPYLQTIPLRSILMLSSHLLLDLPTGLFVWDLPTTLGHKVDAWDFCIVGLVMGISSTQKTNSVELSPSWEAYSRSSSQEISLVYGTERSLPCSRQDATGRCPEPDAFSSHLHTKFLP